MWECMTSKDRYGWRVAAQAFGDCARAKDSMWSWSDPVPAIQELVFAAGAVSLMAAGAVARGIFSPTAVHRLRTMRQAGLTMPIKYAGRLLMRPGKYRPFRTPVNSVAFICHGNIMRSAIAEAMFRSAAPGIRVESAGTFAIAGLKLADVRAMQAAAEEAAEFGRLPGGTHRPARSRRRWWNAPDLLVGRWTT